jgi:hypothetical protein
MQFGKQAVVDFIESEMGPGQAHAAAQQLPDQVDHERHDALLRQLGVDPHDLARRLGGVPGDRASHSGEPGEVPGTAGRVTGTEDDYENGVGDGATSARV